MSQIKHHEIKTKLRWTEIKLPKTNEDYGRYNETVCDKTKLLGKIKSAWDQTKTKLHKMKQNCLTQNKIT